jgi:2'-phosphotransferase
MNQDQSSILADSESLALSASGTSTLHVSNTNPDNDSSKPSRKHRPGKGKEKETFGELEASSNQPKRNQTYKPGTKLRGQVRDSPDVRISKTLSWLLRHGAQGEGLKMRTDGYVKVDDLVRCVPLLNHAICIDEAVVLAAEPEIESPEFDIKHDQGDREAGFQATL